MESRHSTTSKLFKILTPKHLLPPFLLSLLSLNEATEAAPITILHGVASTCQTHAQLYFWDENNQSLYQIIASKLWEPILNQLGVGACKVNPFGTFPVVNYEQIAAWNANFDTAFFLRGLNQTAHTNLENCIRELFDTVEQEEKTGYSDGILFISLLILTMAALAACAFLYYASVDLLYPSNSEELQPIIAKPIANKDAEEQSYAKPCFRF